MHQHPARLPAGNELGDRTPVTPYLGHRLGPGAQGAALHDLTEQRPYGVDEVLGVVADRGLAFGRTDVDQPVLA
ncbi:Uncharacterised protein [Mycobacteroides abscessus subsp. abscessus]|nr:Uncharacterised protein [Mycobacteroides abscessus subsp. abscessus]